MPRFVSRVFSAGLVSICLAGEVGLVNGQAILVDDFNGCNDDGWTQDGFIGPGGTWDASVIHGGSCAFRLATLPASFSIIAASWDASVDTRFSDGFFRATVRPESQETAVVMAMRSVPLGDGYLGELYLDRGIMRIRNHGVEGTLIEKELDIHANEDWYMQIGSVGDQFSFKAWPVAGPEPELPQLTATYSTRTDGVLTIATGVPPGAPFGIGSTIFDDIFFFRKEPSIGDFDLDGALTSADIDILTAGVKAMDPRFDLNNDTFVNDLDREFWVVNLAGTFFGDANLDGSVNSSDLNDLALNWRVTDASSWTQGDFSGDGSVDARDLNHIGLNWRSVADTTATAVPEFSTSFLAGLGLLGVMVWRRKKRC